MDGSDQITITLPFIPPEYERDDYVSYCDIEGCNEVNNNISAPPGFVHSIESSSTINPYQYHLAYDSPCRDMGDPSHDANDLGSYDIDGEERIVNFRVDIGADEIYSCDDDLSEDDIYNVMDWDYDGVVNMHEFSKFSSAWLSHDPNEPGLVNNNEGIQLIYNGYSASPTGLPCNPPNSSKNDTEVYRVLRKHLKTPGRIVLITRNYRLLTGVWGIGFERKYLFWLK